MSWGTHKRQTAIRILHVPTGISAYCDTDRSQHRNKASALALLKARLYANSVGLKPIEPPDGFVMPSEPEPPPKPTVNWESMPVPSNRWGEIDIGQYVESLATAIEWLEGVPEEGFGDNSLVFEPVTK